MTPPDAVGATSVLAELAREVVGLRREAEVLAVALETGRHVVLEGPPGSGKSTLLRGLSRLSARRVLFVEGNAELTPARLVGGFDPALVLEAGYSADTFLEGPLIEALRGDGWLYVEELNRVPEETLNVLVTVLAEGELHVPRLGRIPAAPGFRLVAAMNPFDAIGTARVSQAIADRLCRIAIGYQGEDAERRIVEQVTGRSGELPELMVDQDEVSFIAQTHPPTPEEGAAGGFDEPTFDAGVDARQAREFVMFTPAHTVTGKVFIFGQTNLATFVDSTSPRFVPVIDATTRSLADRKVVSHYAFLLINRTQMIAAAELGGPGDIADEDLSAT